MSSLSLVLDSHHHNCGDEHLSNSQNGAMLTMLAEVATQTLWADNQVVKPSQSSNGIQKKKRSKEINGMPLNQARMLSGNQLVRTFSKFEGDELKRMFSFQCLMVPKKCCVSFESFGSETKARNLIRDHLLTHLDKLPEGEVLEVPKWKEDNVIKKATNCIKPQKKMKTVKPLDSKTSVESVDSKIESHGDNKIEDKKQYNFDSTNKVDLADCCEELQTSPLNIYITPDHDYSLAPQKSLNDDQNEFTDIKTIWIKSNVINDMESGITNYIIEEADCNDHPMLSVSNEVVIKTETDEFGSNYIEADLEDIIKVESEDLPVFQHEAVLDSQIYFDSTITEQDEHQQQKKPKGKAKFIGQSAAEKEMAVRMIESMKLKQDGCELLECQICVPSRVFTAPTTLISHYRSHAGIKPYECHLCGGVFTRQHSLNYHLLIHSNKTRFTCSDCGRKFRHPSHFKEHLRRHTGEAPFECTDCVIRFKTRNTYKRHLKTRHGKVLTQSGGIIVLSEEEFRNVRTAPRSLQTRISNDKENNRRSRSKGVDLLRHNKRRKAEDKTFNDYDGSDIIHKYNLSGNWSTNLLEPDKKVDTEALQTVDTSQTLALLQTVGGSGGSGLGTATVMVLSSDNILYNNITA